MENALPRGVIYTSTESETVPTPEICPKPDENRALTIAQIMKEIKFPYFKIV